MVVLFAFAAVIWTIQAVNFLDLVTDDGHAFRVYLLYSFLTISKVLTKLIPFSFLMASIVTILKLEKDRWWISIADSDVILFAKGLAIGNKFDVKIIEPDINILAVQGPKSFQLMEKICILLINSVNLRLLKRIR